MNTALHRADQDGEHPEDGGRLTCGEERFFDAKAHDEAKATDDKIDANRARDHANRAMFAREFAKENGAREGDKLGHQQRKDHADSIKPERCAKGGRHADDGIDTIDVEKICHHKEE